MAILTGSDLYNLFLSNATDGSASSSSNKKPPVATAPTLTTQGWDSLDVPQQAKYDELAQAVLQTIAVNLTSSDEADAGTIIKLPGLGTVRLLLAECCRVCGCTEEYGCDEGCYWVEENLCSRCATLNKEEAADYANN